LPLVNQLDGFDNAIPHGVVHHLPYMRVQGGANAVIIDPQIGDIGIAVFAQSDISAVKANAQTDARGAANPGSRRKFAYEDGLYIGGVLNGTPTQYVQFNASGISIISPNAVTINAPEINSTGDWTHTGTITASVDVVANGISLHDHVHGGVQAGSGTTGVPE
jgi:phage baseplate assembly protein gpV